MCVVFPSAIPCSYDLQLTAEARETAILQLEILTGIVKGLTRVQRSSKGVVWELEDDFDFDMGVMMELEALNRAREDPRIVNLQQALLAALGRTVELFADDAGIGLVSPLRFIIMDLILMMYLPGAQRSIQIDNISSIGYNAHLAACGSAAAAGVSCGGKTCYGVLANAGGNFNIAVVSRGAAVSER